MKKITLFLMTLMIAGSLFAYEPKKECAKVKRNGDFKYYEKTELYNMYGFKPDPKDLCRWYNLYSGNTYDYDCWVIRKDYTAEQCVDYNYQNFERLRSSYHYFIKAANQPEEPSNAAKTMNRALNALGDTRTPEERQKNTCLSLAELHKRTAIISIPFVTEENFLTLTKEELLSKIRTFVEEVRAENK